MNETRFASVLNKAWESRRPVGAFTCYNLEELYAVVRAAETREAPVIVLISPYSFESKGSERLVRGFRATTAHASVDVLLQLDHVSDLPSIERAIGRDVDAVIADSSKLSFEDNLSFALEAVRAANTRGAGVEAELGRVKRQEDQMSESLVGEMTGPNEAEVFVKKSVGACLTVAVGNVHGNYVGTPSLDWQRLGEVRDLVQYPLSLHGASGLPDDDLRRAISTSVAKSNVNTELNAPNKTL